MKISVVIVNYNVCHYLLQCIDSLKVALSGVESEIFVVDNHSRDNSMQLVCKLHPDVITVENLHNLGFSKANNIALRQAKGEYALLLNPDTIVAEDTIKGVLDFLDHHIEAGAAGVKMLNVDGTLAPESRRGVPTPMTAFYKLSGLCKLFPRSRRFGRYYLGHLPWDSPQRIDIISGAFLLLRHSTMEKVGLLDEDYFMYGEDIDLSYRILRHGYENWYLPFSIMHYKGESTQKSSFRYIHVFYQAMLIFFRKHFTHMSNIITLPIKFAIAFKSGMALVAMLTNKMRRSLGFIDYSYIVSNYHYICFGSEEMIDVCRGICMKHGLDASYFISTDTNQIYNVLTMVSSPTIVVFDPKMYSYGQMLETMQSIARPDVRLGTYQPSTNSIITYSEIIR